MNAICCVALAVANKQATPATPISLIESCYVEHLPDQLDRNRRHSNYVKLSCVYSLSEDTGDCLTIWLQIYGYEGMQQWTAAKMGIISKPDW